MADNDSSGSRPDETGNDNTNVNNTDSGGNFAGEGNQAPDSSSKYGDSFAGGGNQAPDSSSKYGDANTGTPTAV